MFKVWTWLPSIKFSYENNPVASAMEDIVEKLGQIVDIGLVIILDMVYGVLFDQY